MRGCFVTSCVPQGSTGTESSQPSEGVRTLAEVPVEKIAEVMGVTRERVRQIQQKALKKLHKRLGQLFKNEGITPEDAVGMIRNVGGGEFEHTVMEKAKDR